MNAPQVDIDLDTEIRRLVANASTRIGRNGVPAGWIRADELLATLDNGYATCLDCDQQIALCGYCNDAHCVCQQPYSCHLDEVRSERGDQLRAEAKEGLR